MLLPGDRFRVSDDREEEDPRRSRRRRKAYPEGGAVHDLAPSRHRQERASFSSYLRGGGISLYLRGGGFSPREKRGEERKISPSSCYARARAEEQGGEETSRERPSLRGREEREERKRGRERVRERERERIKRENEEVRGQNVAATWGTE